MRDPWAASDGPRKGRNFLEDCEAISALRMILDCGEPAARTLLDRALTPCTVGGRQVIAHQGDPSSHCWFVLEGNVRVQALGLDGQRQQLAQHGPGELFGAYPVPTIHRAEIVAAEDVVLLRGETLVIARLAAEVPEIGAGLATLFARQLDRAMDLMAARNTYSAAGRVYHRLIELADRDNRIVPPPQVTALALSANTTRETASRALAVLTRRGIISRSDEALVILAPRMLLDLVC